MLGMQVTRLGLVVAIAALCLSALDGCGTQIPSVTQATMQAAPVVVPARAGPSLSSRILRIERPDHSGIRAQRLGEYNYYAMLSSDLSRNDAPAFATGVEYLDYIFVEAPGIINSVRINQIYEEIDVNIGGLHEYFGAVPGDQVRVRLTGPANTPGACYVDGMDFALAYSQGFPALGGSNWDISQPRQTLCARLGAGSLPTLPGSYAYLVPPYVDIATGDWVTIPPLPSPSPSPSPSASPSPSPSPATSSSPSPTPYISPSPSPSPTSPMTAVIVNATATPPTFDPTAGETTTLTFDIITTGMVNPTFSWQVSVVTPNNVTFYTFDANAGNLTTSADGNTGHIMLTWNGVNPATKQTIDGVFNFKITGGACDQCVAANQASAQDDAEKPVLRIYEGDSTLLGFDSQGLSPSDFSKGNLQQKVIPFGGTTQWTLVLTGSQTTDRHTVVVNTSVSAPGPSPVTLAPINGSSTTYGANLTVDNKLIGDLDSSYALTPFGSGKLSTNATLEDPNTGAFVKMMTLQDQFPPYPSPRQLLGTFIGPTADFSGDARSDHAPVQWRPLDNSVLPFFNVRQGGYESVSFQMFLRPQVQLKTHLLLRHPARVAWINTDGYHNGDLLMPDGSIAKPGVDFNTSDMMFRGQRTVRSFFLASCAALDLHDYNNVYSLPPVDPSPNPSASPSLQTLLSQIYSVGREHGPTEGLKGADGSPLRVSPGEKWWDALNGSSSQPATVLLGYSAPLARSGATNTTLSLVLNQYTQELRTPPKPNPLTPDVPVEPLAWLVANLKVGQRAVLDPNNVDANLFTAFGAVAWDDQYYYYIPFDLSNPNLNPIEVSEIRRLPLTLKDRDQGWGKIPFRGSELIYP